MAENCNNCKAELRPWTKFKDMKAREGISLAICSSIINGLDHFFAGESRSSKRHADFRTLDLWYCDKCRSYYLKCPGCGTYNHMDDMPVETKYFDQLHRLRKEVALC